MKIKVISRIKTRREVDWKKETFFDEEEEVMTVYRLISKRWKKVVDMYPYSRFKPLFRSLVKKGETRILELKGVDNG